MYHSFSARLPIWEDSGWQRSCATGNSVVIDILLISWFLPVWLWERCPEISPTSFETQCHNIPENGRSIIYLIRPSLMYWVLTYCVEDPAGETKGTETRERWLLCVHLFSPPAVVCGQPALCKVLEVRLGSPRGTASEPGDISLPQIIAPRIHTVISRLWKEEGLKRTQQAGKGGWGSSFLHRGAVVTSSSPWAPHVSTLGFH